MSAPHREIVEFVIDHIQQDVSGATEWEFHRDEPLVHSAGKNCAVWWIGDEVNTENSTTGWLETVDAFGIRYWEAAPDQQRGQIDSEQSERIEDLMDAVRGVLFDVTGDAPGSYETRYRAALKLTPARDGELLVRGFEVAFQCRRATVYT